MPNQTPPGWGARGGASTAPPGPRAVGKRDPELGSTAVPAQDLPSPCSGAEGDATSSLWPHPANPFPKHWARPQSSEVPNLVTDQLLLNTQQQSRDSASTIPSQLPPFCPRTAARGSPWHPARVRPGANMGQVRFEMLPEPRERRQPWRGNSISFSPAARPRLGTERGCVLARPCLPSHTQPLCPPVPAGKNNIIPRGKPEQPRIHGTAVCSQPASLGRANKHGFVL